MSGQSILVVDDEVKILDAICRELFFWKNQRNVTIFAATSAKNALEILDANNDSIQVLISDLKMSSVGGDELICETRRRYPDIRCILITGYGDVAGVSRAVSAGITAFIMKPWETTGLIGEIEKAMSLYGAEKRDKEYLGHLVSQLQSTAQIQRRLFGKDKFPHARFNVEVAYQPLRDYYCGGDFYQVIPLSEERCILIIGDVAGHGLGAAFVTGIVRTLISREELVNTGEAVFSPGAFLGRLNDLILRELAQAPEFIVTLTAVYLDCSAGVAIFSNAGSLPLYLARTNECTIHTEPGFPCGFTQDAQYTEHSVSVTPGDKVVLMTDGLVERGRIAGYVNSDAVRALLMHFHDDKEYNRKILDVIIEMFPEKKFYDDVTLMTIDILSSGGI
jgi:sigma-B regulation protein RsbU (phosphoserine phosphatase)